MTRTEAAHTGDTICRRRLLAASATAAVGVAGCVETGGETAGSLTNTPTAVVVRYYHAATQADNTEEFADQVRSVTHEASTFDQQVQFTETYWESARRVEIDTVRVVRRDVSQQLLVDKVGFLGASVLPLYGEGRTAELEAISGTNAIVRVLPASPDTAETDNAVPEKRPERTDTQEWLVATEGDKWQLVWE